MGSLSAHFRTHGGHRRYSLTRLKQHFVGDGSSKNEALVVAYARVSSHDQKDDLQRQVGRLNDYCQRLFKEHVIISDLVSSLNYKNAVSINCFDSYFRQGKGNHLDAQGSPVVLDLNSFFASVSIPKQRRGS